MKKTITILILLGLVFLASASAYASPSEDSGTNNTNLSEEPADPDNSGDENATFIADFTAFPVSGMAPLTVNFQDSSSSDATTWEWDFDSDGTIDSSEKNPVYEFPAAGNYDVTLRAGNGVVQDNIVKSNYITVEENTAGEVPDASFSAFPTEGKAPLNVQFTDTSTGNVTSWLWDFGDGETSASRNPGHTYVEAGIYKVSLTVSNEYGSDSPENPFFVNVSSSPAPAVDFKSDVTSGKAPLKVQFSDLTTGSPTAWEWDFNSDGKVDSNERNPVYEFENPGTYTVTLKAGNDNGWSDIKKENYITVGGADLRAGFTFSPRKGQAPLTVQFTDTSTGGVTAWSWDFGDGATSTSRNPNHIYSRTGTYTVKLTVTDGSSSNTLKAPSPINVLPRNDPPVDPPNDPADPENPPVNPPADPPNDPADPENPPVNPPADPPNDPVDPVDPPVDSPADPENPPANPPVDPDDPVDPPVDSPVVNPPVVNPPVVNPPVDPVDPPVIDSPVVNSPVDPPVVNPPSNPPVVNSPVDDTSGIDFKSDITSGKAPLTVHFKDNSGGNPVAWEWDFNSDGQVDSNERNPVYEFKHPGTYSVTLRAGSGISWRNIIKTGYITVEDSFQAGFTAFPIQGEAPLTVQFTDMSTGNITSWFWDFGDGNISTFQNPIHTYYEIGNYSVTLNVSNAYENNAFAWTEYITVTEEGEGSGSNSRVSGTEGWSFGETGSAPGGGGSPEPASNIYTSVLSQKFVTAGNRIRFDFIQNATSIDFVEFDAKKTLGKTTTIVEQLKDRSVLAPIEPGGIVYKYMNIWVGNENFANPENIENAVIGFKISKAEIPVNETENSTVFLQRYSNGGWNALNTQKTGEDNRYIYYRARTPGFSPFAITFGRTTTVEPDEVNESIRESPESPVENESVEKPENLITRGLVSEEDWPGFSSAIGPFIGLMLILFIALAIREKIK
ncbi:PKD domain-containing protein [Methanosarcina sp. MSH10X1]|uniref:PKD domain-containing protein n=1 Tax=Methanosarcina sp. MSH10X1 TaxID=2507075 RepID=UPI000FFC4C42|nr:PKD domain-containing protein [Methanosarcina sp. MSH10X1]RXA20193.1 PKD domain-containing protein [Methanosarcina sp. MSH10X1]